MRVQLAKSGVDLGIVIGDSESSLAFYCGLLGLEHVADMPMPIGGGGTMHRVRCGESLLKLVRFDSIPPAATGNGIAGALGFRYLTLVVSNLDEIHETLTAADVPVAIPVTEVREGVRILIVEDPDGNWVEFVENA